MPRASQRSHTHPNLLNSRKPPKPIGLTRSPKEEREGLSPILDWASFESLALPGENVAYSLHDGNGVFLESTEGSSFVWGSSKDHLVGHSVFDIVAESQLLGEWMLQTSHSRDESQLNVTLIAPESESVSIILKAIPTFIAESREKTRVILKATLNQPSETATPFARIESLQSTHQPDGVFLSSNKQWDKLSDGKHHGANLSDMAIDSDSGAIKTFLGKISSLNSSQTCVVRMKSSGEHQRVLLLTGQNHSTQADVIAVEARDITLDRSNVASSLLKVGIEFIKESVLILSKEAGGFQICYVNRAFETMTGHCHSSIVGSSISRLIGPNTIAKSAQAIDTAIEQALDFKTELTLYRKDESSFWSKAELHPMSDNNGRADFFLLTLEDITEAKEVANELEDRNAELKEALKNLKDTQRTIIQQENLRALGQMASGIAHDFNNLLAPILGFSELLLKNPENITNEAKLVPYLEKIQVAAKDGAAVVGRLREFYRSQNGDEAFHSIDPEELVIQAKEITSHRWKNQAEARGAKIDFATSIKCGKQINGNASELRQVFTNLIINAVDAITDSGSIHIDVSESNNAISFKITDTGSGMSAATKAKCLDPFYTTKGKLGTGLGLSIVLGVVQRHGGQFNIESKPGKGTEIEMTFPAVTGKPKLPEVSIEKAVCPKLRVLLVDDEEVLLEVISELLGSSGHIVDNYSDPLEALSEFKANHYDLVITDRAMPTMSGDQLAKAIKTESPQTPVFMVTGFGDMIKETGEFPEYVDEVLAKPLPLDLLNQKVIELVAKKN